MFKNRFWAAALVLVVSSILGYFVLNAIMYSALNSFTANNPSTFLAKSDSNTRYTAASVQSISSPTDLNLNFKTLANAWLIFPEIDKNFPIIIINPDFQHTKADYLFQAQQFSAIGYNVLIFDYEPSTYYSFGLKEQLLLIAYADSLCMYFGARPHIILSSGFGGVVALYASQNMPQVKALILQNTICQPKAWLKYKLQGYWLSQAYITDSLTRNNYFFNESLFAQKLASSTIPIYFIANKAESYFLALQTIAASELCLHPQKELWKTYNFNLTQPDFQKDYLTRLSTFIRKASNPNRKTRYKRLA